MKTKYLFGALATLMVVACSKDELVSVKQDGIAYSVTAATQTRAADSYCNNTLPEAFKVWAKTADGKLYINGDKIVNNSGVWTDADGTRYWPDNNTLDFYAQVNGDNEFKFNDGAPTFENFTVKDNVREQLDLLYSVRKEQSKPGDGKVVLNFRHALSQVCFRARNNMKNMQVEIKGVSVGHLANVGTFAFPAGDTDINYEHHNDNVDSTAILNGGVWTISDNALYNKTYSVTPIGGSVTLAADSKETGNLTCPADQHVNGFEQVLTLLPQTVAAWNPEEKGEDFNGAYFLVDIVLSNIVKNDDGENVATVVYDGKAAIPVSIAWKQGYRYIYTFVFDEGGDGGWTPDPSDPKPVLTSVKYDVTVDDFIPVEEDITMDTGKEDTEEEETVVDHTKNPLLKWAETDLVYNKTSKTSGFASSYTIQGSLYQWGRNPGWTDYLDAMNEKTGKKYYYATYDKTYYTATGMTTSNGQNYHSEYSYRENDSFAEYDYFFMNPNGNDYWIGEGGGTTWSERASACGIKTRVCPEGWRIPNKADFLEIKPSEALKGNGDLASVAARTELRKIEGVCTYAIRWSAETKNSTKTYLRIDALVVPGNFDEESLPSIDWAGENVVTRYFGANGFINAFYHVNVVGNNYISTTNFPVARPMPGTETHVDKLEQYRNGSFTVLWNNIIDYSVNNEGYYWMADEKSAFRFQDNTRIKVAPGADNSRPFKDTQSLLGITSVDAQDCCSIRCVKETE